MNGTNVSKIWREYVQEIIQEAPKKLGRHAVFEQLRKHPPKRYLLQLSRTICLNVSRHQPIIPYGHLLNEF